MKNFFLATVLASAGCSKDESPGRQGAGGDTGDDAVGADDPVGDGGGGSGADTGTGIGEPEGFPTDPIGNSIDAAASVREWVSWSESLPLATDAIDYAGDLDVYAIALPRGTIGFVSARSTGADDLQLRLIAPSGTALGGSQVMPYYAAGSDPGIWVHSVGPAPVYVEVSSESSFQQRSEYQLHGIVVEGNDGEPNDTIAEASDRLGDGTAGFRSSVVGESSHIEFLGSMEATGDVDSWTFNAPSTGLMGWSLWRVGSLLIQPSITLMDASGEEVAWSTEPYFYGSGAWFDDGGLLVPVSAGQRYTLSVVNERPAFGAGTLYVGVATMVASPASESEPNDDSTTADSLSLTDSTVHPGYRSGTIYGHLNAADAGDVFRLSTSMPGFVSVHVQAGTIGSGLVPTVTLLRDADGADVIGTAVANESGDAVLFDVEVAEPEVYIRVEAASRRSENHGNHYAVGFEMYPVPLHN